MADRVQEKVGEFAADTKTQAEQQIARLSDVIKDQPISAILIAATAGYLLGRLTR